MAVSAALDVTRRIGRRETQKAGRRLGLLGVFGGRQVVKMEERRHGYFPKVFSWRGVRYDVLAVEHCWSVTRRRLLAPGARRHFRVRAQARGTAGRASETFEICQNVRDRCWRMRGRATCRG